MTTRRNTTPAKAHSRKTTHQTIHADRRPTLAERRRAVALWRQVGGFYKTRPENRLIGRYPAETLKHCADAISSFAEPNAEGAMMLMIADALEHAETVIREVGAEPDFERELRAPESTGETRQ